jgi:putative CocE/NonD family hydrolase
VLLLKKKNLLHRRSWSAGLVAAIVMITLAGCGGGSGGTPAGSPTASVQHTTIGTRTDLAKPETIATRGPVNGWTDYNPPDLYPRIKEMPLQYITMRDGVQLAALVTLPADDSGNPLPGPFPALLIQTAYNEAIGRLVPIAGGASPYLVKHGYATVAVDVRGTGQSLGQWEAFGATEQADYGEVVQWIAQQPWFNGSMAAYGYSYVAITALLTAEQQHPEIKAVFAGAPIGDSLRDVMGTGGQANAVFGTFWMTITTICGVLNPTIFTDPAMGIEAAKEHLQSALTNFQVPVLLEAISGDPEYAYDGDFWAIRSPIENTARIQVPVFVLGGLHDIFQRAEPQYYEALKNQVPTKLLIGPWEHLEGATGKDLDKYGLPPLAHIQLQWFDQYVKGMNVGADKLPNVTQYIAGYDRYVTAADWPHPQAMAQRLYMHGDLSLSEQMPQSDEKTQSMHQTPLEGLCSITLQQWTFGILGYYNNIPCFSDDARVERYNANYETAPMAEDYYINGPIEADIWMSTTRNDAALSVRVDDVQPDGTVTPLTNGLMTASFRAVDTTRSRFFNGQMIQPWHPFTQDSVQAVGPDNIVMVPVEIFPTSALIEAGHKLRVSVGPSNLAQGLSPIPTLVQSAGGKLTIYNDAEHPSSVVLPVVPASALTQ